MVGVSERLGRLAVRATEEALMAALSGAGRTCVAAGGGFVVDALDGNWSFFFIATALMVLPSLYFLYRIKDKIQHLEHPPT